jgi:hypothetical protein
MTTSITPTADTFYKALERKMAAAGKDSLDALEGKRPDGTPMTPAEQMRLTQLANEKITVGTAAMKAFQAMLRAMGQA